VQHEVGAAVERPQVNGRRRRRIDDDRGGVGRGRVEVGHRQERVGRRFEPDEVDSLGRRSGLVELDVLEAPTLQFAKQRRRAVVAPLRDRDRVSWLQQRENERRRRS
jgi:hypothetical protein